VIVIFGMSWWDVMVVLWMWMYILDSNYCGSLTCKKDYSHKSLEISFRNYSLIFSLIVSELPKILRLYGDALSIVQYSHIHLRNFLVYWQFLLYKYVNNIWKLQFYCFLYIIYSQTWSIQNSIIRNSMMFAILILTYVSRKKNSYKFSWLFQKCW
jgi:hypothetical protein